MAGSSRFTRLQRVTGSAEGGDRTARSGMKREHLGTGQYVFLVEAHSSNLRRYASASAVERKSRATLVERMVQHLGGIEVESRVASKNKLLIQSPQYEVGQRRHGWSTGASSASQQISHSLLMWSTLGGGRSSTLTGGCTLERPCKCASEVAA